MRRVILRTQPGPNSIEICRLLRDHNIDARVEGNPNPDPIMLYAAKGTYTVGISVPGDSVDRATELVLERERRCATAVADAVRTFRRQATIAGCIGLAVALIAAPFVIDWYYLLESVALLTLLTAVFSAVALVVIAKLDGRRARKRLSNRRCAHCDYPLIGLTESRCPECGKPFSEVAIKQARSEQQYHRHWLRRIAIALLHAIILDWSFSYRSRPQIEAR